MDWHEISVASISMLLSGAVPIDVPPKHGAAVLRSGTWDYSAVPDDVRQVLGNLMNWKRS